jgi:hypothetical protein
MNYIFFQKKTLCHILHGLFDCICKIVLCIRVLIRAWQHEILYILHLRISPQNRYQTRRDTPMCFGWTKTSEFFLRAMTPSWSAHGTLYLCFPMKNFRVHSRMASYEAYFHVSTCKISDKISSEWHFWSSIYSVISPLMISYGNFRSVAPKLPPVLRSGTSFKL